MSNDNKILSEADEVRALLPWFVSGKISDADRAKVEAYAAKHPGFAKEIEIAREEADQVFTANAEIDPPRAALDKLMKSVAASPTARLHSAGTSLIDKLGNFLASFAPRQLAYAALTAALALALVAGGIGARLAEGPARYEVATGGDKPAAGKGTFALISFAPAAPAAAVSAFLTENKLTIVDGPNTVGLYRVRLSENVLDEAAAKAKLDALKARADLIATALPAPSSN